MSDGPTALNRLTARQIVEGIRRGDFSAREVVDAALERIDARDPAIHAFISVLHDSAGEQADAIDRRARSGEDLPPLAGVPVALKDNICTAGVRTTCGSRILETFVPPYDATVVERLRAAGAIVIGKTNLDEFAMGSTTEFSAFFPTANPCDPSRVPGGSSGGSAAAVADFQVPIALGSDTGGSIRLPASFCGVVGLKPTYGRVSRYGLVAFGSSLDQIGPFARDVADAALVLNAIAGHDPNDSTSLAWPVPDYPEALRPDLAGLRVGVPNEYFVAGMDTAVSEAVSAAIGQLGRLGATVDGTSLPNTRFGLAAYYVVAPAEASANLARYDGVKYGLSASDEPNVWEMFNRTRERGFGAEVKRRIMVGTYALSSGYYEAYYLQAQKARTLIKADFDRAFETFDVLAVPTAPSVAFPIGSKVDDPVAMYLTDVCTVTVNAAGLPGIVVPCGLAEGLPVGLQLLGPAGGEERLLRTAHAFERSGSWRERRFGVASARSEP